MRMKMESSVLCAFFAILLLACSTTTPEVKAAGIEKLQCDRSTAASEARLLGSTQVISVEPLYSFVHSSYSHGEERVNGAKLRIRPPEGVPAETLTRVLQCRGARELLGKQEGAAVDSDPFWLPDAWVDVDVKSDDGNFVVVMAASSVENGLRVLGRARHYADKHMLASRRDAK